MQNMDELKSIIREFIQNSEEYQDFKKLESVVMRNPDLKRQIDEFRKRNFEIQNSEDDMDLLDETERLNEQYQEMRSQEMVNRYLNSELCLCRMIQDICNTAVDAVDFDLDFFR